MIGAALARTAIEEPIPSREITTPLINEIRFFCNHVCGEGGRAGCPVYADAQALKECVRVKNAEPDLRKRAGC